MATAGTVKRNVLASWGTHASNLVFGFFLTRYTLDVLGVSTYGSWLLINSIASYAGLLYCGLGETVSRYVAKYHSEGNPTRVNQMCASPFRSWLSPSRVARRPVRQPHPLPLPARVRPRPWHARAPALTWQEAQARS